MHCSGKNERPGIVTPASPRGFVDSHGYGSYYLCFLKIEFGGKRGFAPQSRANQDGWSPQRQQKHLAGSSWVPGRTVQGWGACISSNSLSITSLCETQAQMAYLYRQQSSLYSTCPNPLFRRFRGKRDFLTFFFFFNNPPSTPMPSPSNQLSLLPSHAHGGA